MKRLSPLLNWATALLAIHLFLLVCLVPYKSVFLSHSGVFRVAALDRAQVIDENALRDFNPDLASNLRYNVGVWITEKYARALDRFWLCEVVFTLGGLILVVAMKRRLAAMERAQSPEDTIGEIARVSWRRKSLILLAFTILAFSILALLYLLVPF